MSLEQLTELTHVQSLGFMSYVVGKFYIQLKTKQGDRLVPVVFEDMSLENDYSRLLLTIDNVFEMIITDSPHLNTVIHKLIAQGATGITSSWLFSHGFTPVSKKLVRYQLFIDRGDYECEEE